MILDDENILIQAAVDSAHYEMVDLGLSVKWADKNVGASYPEDAGLYFQWGNTIGYTADQLGKDKVFDKYSYPERLNVKYNSTNGLKVLEPEDDAAIVYMGSQYRMPTRDEIRELICHTTQTFIDINNVEYSQDQAENGAIEIGKLKGVRFTGSTGNSIFIPAAGLCKGTILYGMGRCGKYWSSNLDDDVAVFARYLYLYDDGDVGESSSYCCWGLSVRGVEKIINKS